MADEDSIRRQWVLYPGKCDGTRDWQEHNGREAEHGIYARLSG